MTVRAEMPARYGNKEVSRGQNREERSHSAALPHSAMSKFCSDIAEFELFGPSRLRPGFVFGGDSSNCRDMARPVAAVLGMWSVESRLLLFDPVLPTRWGSSSHIVPPVKGRVF